MAVPLGKDFVPAGQPQPDGENLASDVARVFPDGRFWHIWHSDGLVLKRIAGKFGCTTGRRAVSVADGKRRFDGNELAFSDDGQRIFFVTSVKGRRAIMSVDISGKQPPVEISPGDASELRLVRGQSGPALYFTRSSLQRPPEVYRVDLDAMGKAIGPASQVTRQNDPLLAEVRPGPASQLFARSQDGLTLHSHVVTPDFTPTQKYPAVILIHGGPQGARGRSSGTGAGTRRCSLGRGYVVLMANPRGSEGFGQKFLDGCRATGAASRMTTS